jgi:hypothetical protein
MTTDTVRPRPAWLDELRIFARDVLQNEGARAPDLSLVGQVLGLLSEDLMDRENDTAVDGALAGRVMEIAGRALEDPATPGADLRAAARVVAMVMSVAGGTEEHLSSCEEHVRVLLEAHKAAGEVRSDYEDAARVLLDGARDIPANREARLDLAFETAHMAFEAQAPMLLTEAIETLRTYECGDPIPVAWFVCAADHARAMGWADQAVRIVGNLADMHGTEPPTIASWKGQHTEWLQSSEADADLPRLVVTELSPSE